MVIGKGTLKMVASSLLLSAVSAVCDTIVASAPIEKKMPGHGVV
jgi:hypothetical protein